MQDNNNNWIILCYLNVLKNNLNFIRAVLENQHRDVISTESIAIVLEFAKDRIRCHTSWLGL